MREISLRPLGALLAIGAVAAALVGASSASALTIGVTTTADSWVGTPADCSLREAIQSAATDIAFDGCSTGSGADTIQLPQGEYKITRPGVGANLNETGDLDVTGGAPVTIEPADGQAKVTINGNGIDRVIEQTAAALTVRNLTLTGGKLTAVENGGGILNSVGVLTLEGVTISGNEVAGGGGGVAAYEQVSIVNSTISDNNALQSGGGVYLPGTAKATLRSVTITDNTADSIADGNGDGGGLYGAQSDPVNFHNVINAGNEDLSPLPGDKSPDCYTGGFFFPRFVLTTQALGAGSCLIAPGSTEGNQVAGDPMIGPLADNGGQTRTHALLEGSPAIGAGGTTGDDACPPTDQTGRARPADSCDIGAVQFIENVTPVPPKGSANMKIVKVKPKKLILKRGKKPKKAKAVVRNSGDAAATGVKVCLKLSKKTKKAIKLKGKTCRTVASFATGKKTFGFKLKAKKKAKRKSYSGKVTVASQGAGTKKAKLKIKVK